MSEETNVMLRSLLFQVKMAQKLNVSLDDVVRILEGIAGKENVALVNDEMSKMDSNK